MKAERVVLFKGSGLRAGLRFVSRTFGPETLERLLAAIPEHQAVMRAALPSSWYPVSVVGQLYEQLPTVVGRSDRAGIERLIKDMNRAVAEENLSKLYKALVVLMTPERLFDVLPRLWLAYFKGIEIATERLEKGRGICTVHGVGDLVPYLGPGASGCLELAWGRVGGELKVWEEGWAKGDARPDPLIFQLDWR